MRDITPLQLRKLAAGGAVRLLLNRWALVSAAGQIEALRRGCERAELELEAMRDNAAKGWARVAELEAATADRVLS